MAVGGPNYAVLVWSLVALCHGAEFTYFYAISEEAPPAHSTFIGNIPNDTNLQSMVSSADLPNLRYSFLTEGGLATTQHFSLDETTGNLRTASNDVLDRETLCPFATTCKLGLEIAIKSTMNQFFRTVAVEITINDINDNTPTFASDKITLNISESVVTGSSFALEGAVDRDTGVNNSLQTYTLLPKDGPFEIKFTKNIDGTSYLHLVLNEKLDHEVQDSYNFRVIAEDGGVPALQGALMVEVNVLDINDNRPQFTDEFYNVVVPENVTFDTAILTVTATDADSGDNGDMRFSLSTHQSAKNLKLFTIDSKTGELKVTGDLQKEAEEKYDIIVEVRDSGRQPFTTQTVVTVNILDTINSPPRIRVNLLTKQNFSFISEYANLGVVVAHVRVYESDRGRNGIVQCDIQDHDYFELQGFDVNEYKVIVAKPLDRETIDEHKLTVVCEDAGTPPLSVNSSFVVKVIDENDNDPIFTSQTYSATIEENNRPGTSILRVLAQDMDTGNNSLVQYSLSGNDREEFIISSQDGLIMANSVFDYESRPVMNFTVTAVDKGNPPRSSTAKVTVRVIDVNDEKPKFAFPVFHFNISENAKFGQTVGQIVTFDFESGKNGEVFVKLAPGFSDISPFTLFENGTVVLTNTVDYEMKKEYEFKVVAVDRGTPPLESTSYVRISILDYNDNVPVIVFPNIHQHTIQISTDFAKGHIFTTVIATDADVGKNAALKYLITSRNDSARFDINPKTGNISVAKSLNEKDINVYKLMIMVQDQGLPPFASHAILMVHVVAGNGSIGGLIGVNDQNVLITVTIICVTAVVSAVIVLVIIVMKRKDRERSKHPAPTQYLQTPSNLTQYVDKVKADSIRPKNELETMDEEFGFSATRKGHLYPEMKNNQKNQQYNLATETGSKDEKDGRLDQLTVLQLHHALLQSYQDNQLSTTQKIAVWQHGQDDGHSEGSVESTTSDSGRGGSDEDICSHSGVSTSQIDDLHEISRDTLMNNTSFQSNQMVPSSMKTGPKDNVRMSVRKHVTFRDLSDKKHINNLHHHHHPPPPQSTVTSHVEHSHFKNPPPHVERTHPANPPPPKIPPRENKACGFTVRNPTFSTDTNFHHGNANSPMCDSRLPVTPSDSLPHPRDWRNDSIATTEDGDDRSTTTSGSYTIDNDDSLHMEINYNNFKDIVV